MKRALAAALVLAFTSIASAQYRPHRDYGGYTYRTPSSTYSYRYDTGATYNRMGNIATYSDNTGTYGTSVYTPSYRYDTFNNYREGWMGSGTTYYYTPTYSYYRRYR